MTMKKTFALVAVLALATAACSKPADDAATEADTTAVTDEMMAPETPAAM
jgi:ABC-type glycerol-3-phosphate transport system substrate-binding protein